MPQLTIAILKKAYPKQNMGSVHLTLMTTQYLRDFMFYCAECEYMRVNYSFANPTEIKLTASENTNIEKLDAFLLLLKEMNDRAGNKFKINPDTGELTFPDVVHFAQFLVFATRELKKDNMQSLAAEDGPIFPPVELKSTRPISAFHLKREFYCGRDDLNNAINIGKSEIRGNPFIHFTYTDVELDRAIKTFQKDRKKEKTMSYGQVLRFH